MKKILALLLMFAMLLSLAACGEDPQATTATDPTGNTQSPTESPTVDPNWIPYADSFSGGIALVVSDRNSSGMTAEKILNFCSWEIFHSYIYEQRLNPVEGQYQITVGQKTFSFNQYVVPEDVVIRVVEQFFITDDFTYEMLRSSSRYNSNDKTFLCTDPIWFTGIDSKVLAYEKLGGNDYQLYLEARVNDHPGAACTECATTDSCVLERLLFSVIVCGAPDISPMIILFQNIDSIPDTAITVE